MGRGSFLDVGTREKIIWEALWLRTPVRPVHQTDKIVKIKLPVHGGQHAVEEALLTQVVILGVGSLFCLALGAGCEQVGRL